MVINQAWSTPYSEIIITNQHVRSCIAYRNYHRDGWAITVWLLASVMSHRPLSSKSSTSKQYQSHTIYMKNIKPNTGMGHYNPNQAWPSNKHYNLCLILHYRRLGRQLGRIVYPTWIGTISHWLWHCVVVRDRMLTCRRWLGVWGSRLLEVREYSMGSRRGHYHILLGLISHHRRVGLLVIVSILGSLLLSSSFILWEAERVSSIRLSKRLIQVTCKGD